MGMVLAGITVSDSALVHEAIELARTSSSPFLFNHVMRSWLFCVLAAERAQAKPDPELLAVAAVLHDLGLTERHAGQDRFEVDGANAARLFLKGHGIPQREIQLVWDAIALHTTRSIALHKEPEVAVTHAGISLDVLGAGLDLIPQDTLRAIITEFPRLSMKTELKDCLCSLVRRKPETTYDNVLRDIGIRYVDGYTSPSFADRLKNAPFAD
jgi:hypothetical protein